MSLDQMESDEINVQVTSPTSLARRTSLPRSSSVGQNERQSLSRSFHFPSSRMSKISHKRKSSASELAVTPSMGHCPNTNSSQESNSFDSSDDTKEDSKLDTSELSGPSDVTQSTKSIEQGNLAPDMPQLSPEKAIESTQSLSPSAIGSNTQNSQPVTANTLSLSSSNNFANSGGISSFSSSTVSFTKKHLRRSLLRETFSSLTREKETCAPIPESSSTEITYEGYLTKRGHVFTNWKTRFFVLSGNVLEYYSSEEKTKRYGSVVVAKVAPWSGEAHGFMFYTTKQIPYYVYAASEAEKTKWLRALREFYVEPDEVTCEGYLTRRGHLVPSQRVCYYVLSGTYLRHYADQQAYRDNDSAMAEVEIRSIAAWDAEVNGLMFKTMTGNVFYASTETESERQRWVSNHSNTTTSNTVEPVACAGYLTKQGHKRKSWKKRYFILRGNIISYYQDYDLANNAKGKALAEVQVEDVQKWDGEAFGFMFMTTEQVPYYVYADNERERKKWMSALRKLSTLDEDTEVEKKRCSNCQAVLTGSRFCGACGFNLRGTVGERSKNSNRTEYGMNNDEMDEKDEADQCDEDTGFDELEALSEGARTLLLAVMQTPDGVDVGDKDGAFPSRLTVGGKALTRQFPEVNSDDTVKESLEEELRSIVAEIPLEESEQDQAEMKRSEDSIDKNSDRYDLKPSLESDKGFSIASNVCDSPRKIIKMEPNFDIVETNDTTDKSFRSFGESDEEKKEIDVFAERRTSVPVNRSKMMNMGPMGRRRTLHSLAMESSSDEEDDLDNEKTVKEKEHSPERKDSQGSSDLELDTRGIAAWDEPNDEERKGKETNIVTEGRPPSAKANDLCHYMERELDFTPLFVPSSDSPIRCRLYSSMAYATAKRVILFLSDSGPLGLWRQDPTNQIVSTRHPWSMAHYLSRAQEEGYGVLLCNPFSNTAVVYEAGGFERTVPIPNSGSPKEHVLFVWNQFAVKCKGEINVIAYARGGALVKSILESYEVEARDKIHRIVFIDSKHTIDGNESPSVLELLGRRSINWEASFEPLGAQIVDSQARVGCVCLSTGHMPQHGMEFEAASLQKAEDAAFAFVNANPDRPGMTAVVKHVRATLRKRKMTTTANPTTRKSNILVLGETEIDESSDTSATEVETIEVAVNEKSKDKPPAPYYLPKPTKPRNVTSNTVSDQTPKSLMSMKDFELLRVVGQGGFGKVFLCRKLTPPRQGESFAMKVLKKQHVVSSGLVNTTMAERKILTEITHPFVVKLYYAFQSDSKLYLVMDYLSGGSLAFHLRRRRKFSEDWARFYAAEVAAAMAHLHSVNIIYRDAKLENVLVDHQGHVRITDFGLSKVGVSDLKGATTFCGTAAYIAPELLKGQAYGKAADWWSFGILLYEMIGGKPPYYHRNRDIMFQTILKQEWVTFTPSFSDEAVSLIRGVRICIIVSMRCVLMCCCVLTISC